MDVFGAVLQAPTCSKIACLSYEEEAGLGGLFVAKLDR